MSDDVAGRAPDAECDLPPVGKGEGQRVGAGENESLADSRDVDMAVDCCGRRTLRDIVVHPERQFVSRRAKRVAPGLHRADSGRRVYEASRHEVLQITSSAPPSW